MREILGSNASQELDWTSLTHYNKSSGLGLCDVGFRVWGVQRSGSRVQGDPGLGFGLLFE